jgi:hypothetical protein
MTAATQQLISHRIATRQKGGFISATTFNPYTVEYWDSRSRAVTRALHRRTEWYRDNPLIGPRDGAPPPAEVKGVSEDAHGLLWVLMWVPARDWRRALKAAPSGSARPEFSVQDVGSLYDTVVEVVDPAGDCVRAAGRFPGPLYGFARDNVVFAFREAANGFMIEQRRLAVAMKRE